MTTYSVTFKDNSAEESIEADRFDYEGSWIVFYVSGDDDSEDDREVFRFASDAVRSVGDLSARRGPSIA